MSGWWSEYIGDPIQGAWDKIRGKEELDLADDRREQGDELLDQQLQQIYQMQEQYNEIYKPLLEQNSQRLLEGPQYDRAADAARDDFGLSFDRSVEAERMNQRRNGMDPTSSQAQRLGEDNAYNRALGMATTANAARTEEDDRHWARSLSFAHAGNGIQSQVISGLGSQANANYGVADDYVDEAGNNLEFFGSLAGSALGAFSGNPTAAPQKRTPDTASPFGSFGGSSAGGLTPPGGYGFQSSGQVPNSFGSPSAGSSNGRIPQSF